MCILNFGTMLRVAMNQPIAATIVIGLLILQTHEAWWVRPADDSGGDFVANWLLQHEQVHSRRDIVCWGCNQRSFATYSAMLIHTESGKCTVSQVWLDECSERCYQSKKYVVEEFRTFLRKGERPDDDEIEYLVDQGSGYGVWECVICQNQYDEEVQLRQHIKSRVHDPLVYECPSCDNQFRRLSALVQHVEKGSCSEGLREGSCSIGKMLHYIHVRLDLCDAVLEDGGILIN